MKILKNIAAIYFIFLGMGGLFLYWADIFSQDWQYFVQSKGIDNFMIITGIIGAALSLIGGIQTIRNKLNAVVFLLLSIIDYIAGGILASYIKFEGNPFINLMPTFYYISGSRVIALGIIWFLLIRLNDTKANKNI